jgi:penicillin-insensitive murein endopeptidase
MMSTVVVAQDGKDVDPNVWTPAHAAIIKATAKDPQVSRIFANPAIKKALCREAGRDRAWLRKVRPWYGHDYHFHVRIYCPRGQSRLPAGAADCSGRGLRRE